MKKQKINLKLKKSVMSQLNSEQAEKVNGGGANHLKLAGSGNMMCLPDSDTSKAQCPTASDHNLCATQVIC